MNDFDFARALTAWYDENKRALPWRETTDPYAIWISEIMLQQTRVEAVKPYYEAFLKALPDVRALAAADDETLCRLWQGLGYYARVRNMKKAAQTCVALYGGKLPEDYEKLRALCGIGDYTAGAVASFAFGAPVPAIDGNVLRVLARYLGIRTAIDQPAARREIAAFIKENIPANDAARFNQALIELGATLCGPDRAARCGGCPLVSSCRAFACDETDTLPVRSPKPERKTEKKTPLILIYNDAAALEKRAERGLLAGLWQPPTLEGHATGEEVLSYLARHGAQVLELRPLPPATHIFTHIVWDMRGYLAVLSEPGDLSFFDREERAKRAIPSAFRAYAPYLSQRKPPETER